MDRYKSPNAVRGLANVLLSPGVLGRPMAAAPGIPSGRVRILRAAYAKTLGDPAVVADLKKRGWQASPVSGEELETVAKDVVAQPPEVVEKMKQLLELTAK
jgi:tripartite-type tricarboxylate transporter receptor subunit TctC